MGSSNQKHRQPIPDRWTIATILADSCGFPAPGLLRPRMLGAQFPALAYEARAENRSLDAILRGGRGRCGTPRGTP